MSRFLGKIGDQKFKIQIDENPNVDKYEHLGLFLSIQKYFQIPCHKLLSYFVYKFQETVDIYKPCQSCQLLSFFVLSFD